MRIAVTLAALAVTGSLCRSGAQAETTTIDDVAADHWVDVFESADGDAIENEHADHWKEVEPNGDGDSTET